MALLTPGSREEMASALAEAAQEGHAISLWGNNSKREMAGFMPGADIEISTAGLGQLLQYEPNDLTISVGAGMRWTELQRLLHQHGQMLPLDPPFATSATVGGVVASDTSGPLRCGFGTARDLVIGMEFATLDGKLVRSGGMVVKNVAGLDISKLLIGSFGTLGAIVSINFRLHPLPRATSTFIFTSRSPEEVVARRDAILLSPLRPVALDFLSPSLAQQLGFSGYLLALRAAGTERVIARYRRELQDAESELMGRAQVAFWDGITEFASQRSPSALIVRVTALRTDAAALLALNDAATVVRAANGTAFIRLESAEYLPEVVAKLSGMRCGICVEYAPDNLRKSGASQLVPGHAAGLNEADGRFAIMKKLKSLFDSQGLLNHGRFYGSF